jgi:hypothetical protein
MQVCDHCKTPIEEGFHINDDALFMCDEKCVVGLYHDMRTANPHIIPDKGIFQEIHEDIEDDYLFWTTFGD